MNLHNQRDVTIDATLFAELEAYAELHQMPVSDLVARMWTLYRDMSAMRDGSRVPRATLERYQAEHPFVPDGDDTPVQCPTCERMTTKSGLIVVENVTRCTACYTLPHLLQQWREE